MSDKSNEQAIKEHAQHMEERNRLIEAARESARTFNQAILAFGSTPFGPPIAFLKDVAPKPLLYTLVWLKVSWLCFSIGILSVILSFLFSHRACMFDIASGAEALGKPKFEWPKNPWSRLTDWCNILCVVFLFA